MRLLPFASCLVAAIAHGQSPAPRDVVINEIMYDPPAVHGTAANEWIELINRSTGPVDLSLLRLSDATSTPVPIATVPTVLEAGAFAVLVRTAGEFTVAFPGVAFVAVAGFPALNNSGDRPRLLLDTTEIDAVPYAGSWGGTDRSLERRDPAGPSAFPSNWGGTSLPAGGTPGMQNTLYAPDVDGPTVVDVDIGLTADTLTAHFDQPLDGGSVTAAAFSLSGALAPAIVATHLLTASTVALALSGRLSPGEYALASPGIRSLDGTPSTGPPFSFVADPDVEPPGVESVAVADPTTVDVRFTEEVGPSAAHPASYLVSGGVGPPSGVLHPVDGHRDRSRLTLAMPLQERTVYQLEITGLVDLAGNVAADLSATLFYGQADTPQAEDLVVNEIMFDPTGGSRGEYVEVLNVGPRLIDLRDIGLTDGPASAATAVTRTPTLLPPGGIVVLVADRDSFQTRFPGVAAIEAENFPALNNGGDSVVLAHASIAMDSVRFDPAWHRVELEDATGVALERRSAAGPANAATNWSSSLDVAGGTPGRPNSITIVPGDPPDAAGLTVSRSPFDPDAGEATSLAYTLRGEAGLVRLRIFDGAGREVREVEAGHLSGRTGALAWDGRGDDGRPLRVGIYVALLEAVDVEAGSSEAHRAVVVIGRR